MTSIAQLHQQFLKTYGVSTDTRKIDKNVLFFALKGGNFNANTFAKEALEKGAAFVVIDEKDYYIDQRTILVENVLKTLQDLASFHRNYLGLKIIALTGSNGKTTTKELLNVVLATKYIVKATKGNLNNHIGVPLTLLSFTKSTQIGIVEMGANHQQEIDFLCQIAQPDYGYITNFGKAHLEGFGGIEGVIKGKSELYIYLKQHNKTAFVNIDDVIQVDKTQNCNTITFTINDNSANYIFSNIKTNPLVSIQYHSHTIQSNLIGIYNAVNICAAIAIGSYFKVEITSSKQAIETYIPTNNRSQIIQKSTNKIILDAYNANPSSMLLAIQNFIGLAYQNKIMILGDMFELGDQSNIEHHFITNYLVEKASNIECFLIGNYFYINKVAHKKMHFFSTYDDFVAYFVKKQYQNSNLLIKGSRGMVLERVLELL